MRAQRVEFILSSNHVHCYPSHSPPEPLLSPLLVPRLQVKQPSTWPGSRDQQTEELELVLRLLPMSLPR